MIERPFPPSPRRLALARQAGLVAASPVVVGGLACAGIAAVLTLGLGGAARAVTEAIAAACDHRGSLEFGGARTHNLQPLQPVDIPLAVLAVATPLFAAAALALLGHLAQTRSLWLPRRRIAGAPELERGIGPRIGTTAFALTGVTAISAATLGWLWLSAPRLAGLIELPAADMLAAAAALAAMFVAVLATAWLVMGIGDALIRHVELARALAMTAAEKHEDDRLAAADPRWARQRAALARTPSVEPAVRDAAVVLLGDDGAIAVAWDPMRRPIPACVASGRGARATQLVGLARRHRVPVHRDPTLVAELGQTPGPIADRNWPRLAEIIAAVRR